MKILLLHQYYLEDEDAGGSRWNQLTKIWNDSGHEITVIAGMVNYMGVSNKSKYKNKYQNKVKQNGITVHRTYVSDAYNRGFIGRLWGYFSFMFSSLWAGLFKVSGTYDFIIVTSPPLFLGLTGVVISKLKRIPLVFEVRDLWPESAIDTGVVTNKTLINVSYRIEKFVYKNSTLINVLTPAFYKVLLEEKNISQDKLIMIPNASDFSLSDRVLSSFDRDQFRKEIGVQDKFVITYVGAHGIANNLQQILDAGKRLEDTNVLFLLIGDGMEKKKLIDLARERMIMNVRFLDAVPKFDVFKFILASEMGISVLKRNDTFKTVYSNKTFDYFSCKKPVLMAIDGVARKLIVDAKAGSYI